MSPVTAIEVALLAPLLATASALLLARRPNVRELFTVLFGLLLLWACSVLARDVLDGGRPGLELFEVFPGLAIAFELEPLGMLFALVASSLWIVTTCYSIGYMRGHGESNQARYYACFAIAIFGAVGAALSRNLLTLFVFYEILTLSTYPLVAHHQTEKARKGARTYVAILLTTSVAMLLLAVVWTWVATGTLEFRQGGILAGRVDDGLVVPLLALYAFGTGKAALMPFHRWLPAAMVAPTPVSALLHAVAVVKAGVFTVLKVVVYVFGTDFLARTGASQWLMWVAGFTVIAASLVALTKDNLKARLAYSTVSQLGYIVLGAAFANAHGVIGGGMHIAMHAFGKITLFFCAGAIYVAAHKTEISDMRGIGRTMPVTTFAFLLGSLSVIGLPPFGGSWSKWYLALGALDRGEVLFAAVYMASSLLNILYLLPIVVRGFFSPAPGEAQGIREAPLFCVVPLAFTALMSVALFFVADEIHGLLLPLATP